MFVLANKHVVRTCYYPQGTRSQAEEYLKSPIVRGKGARRKIPKLTSDTPHIVPSPTRAIKHKAAVQDEIETAKTKKVSR